MTRRRPVASGWFWSLVLRALLVHRGRTLVAFSAVSVLSAALTASVLLSLGIRKQLGHELAAYGANLVITPGPEGLRDSGLATIAALPGVESVTGQLYASLRVAGSDIEAIGLDPALLSASGWRLEGAWPSAGDVLVGRDLAAALEAEPASTLNLAAGRRAAERRVAGVIESGGPEDRTLILNLADLQGLLGDPGRLSAALARVEAASLEATAQRLRAELPGATVQTVLQVAATEARFLAKMELLMLLATLVVLASSGIAVSSTTNAVVLERTEELGLMRALGGSRRRVLATFFAEALLLGTAGGLIGVG
ncbi:MAG: ABC transporter permease, partial [Deltaproteobacteria bacterium]|nr:ABC transporter permease [Deltaproteobacteria bacterium]MBW2534365.1 ABC transporter permease [Deltaproteobacteria bacterium]